MTVSKERKAELTAQFGNTPVDTGNPNGMNWWLTQHVDPILQEIGNLLRDWCNWMDRVSDHDGRRPSEYDAERSYIDACDFARHMIVRGES